MTPATLLVALLALVPLAASRAQDDVSQLPGPLAEIRFEPPLGERLPRDLRLRDVHGALTTGELLGARPVLLVPVYHECPMLCSLVLDGLLRALRPLELEPGRDVDVVAFSFAPGESARLAAEARARFVRELGGPDPGAGVRFLVGDAPQLERLTRALGFAAVHDPDTGMWAHAGGLVLVAPDGTLTRALSGVEFAPRDLRLAVAEAARGEVRSFTDSVLLYCYRWDPATGRYGAAVMNLVRLGGGLTVTLLLLAVWRARKLGPRDDEPPRDGAGRAAAGPAPGAPSSARGEAR